jgi:hypothetical protein
MLIISGFPGIGKSTLFSAGNLPNGLKISDSDSSKFDKAQFPQNYIDHLKSLDADVVLVSSHKEVRQALVANNMPFFLVYPNANLKDEYMERYRNRGSPESFLALMQANFVSFVTECMKQPDCMKYELSSNTFLIDVFPAICLLALTSGNVFESTSSNYSRADLSGILFDFLGFLTTRDKQIKLSGKDDPLPALELLKEFAASRHLTLASANVETWNDK